jgi:hypothetical protein
MDKELSPLQIELREAMADWGCPLCRLEMRAERLYLDSLNYERVLDLPTRDALKSSRGLCAHHSRGWQTLQGSALGIAIVYRVSVLDLLRATDTPEKPPTSLLRRATGPAQVATALESSGPCPACALLEDTSRRFGDLLLKELKSDEVQRLLCDCGGLCLPHLRTTLSRPGADKTYNILIAVQRRAWTALMAELDEFIRKNDYRFRHEPMESERDAWLRALDVMVGLSG